MDSYKSPYLLALAVFRSIEKEELIRSVHVYRFEDGREERVEREYLFSPASYVELLAHPLLELSSLRVSDFTKGRVIGLWLCIFAFNTDAPYLCVDVPSILTLSRNPKLKSIPTLADDIQKVFELSFGTENKKVLQFAPRETCEEKNNHDFHPKRSYPMLDQDLNCPPLSIDTEELLENQQSEAVPEATVKKKRAATEHIARISFSDIVKYFDVPIVEASRNLKVGLTVLKKKCRELGIPRWPHRKIKSLDTLIHDLQDLREEEELQELENKAAAMSMAQRQRMLVREREGIEKKPSMEIQSETKKFRQDVFKNRHKAKAFVKAKCSSVCPNSKHH